MNVHSTFPKKLILAGMVLGTITLTQAQAQQTTPTPPKMVPEMTEFWEPEVKVITPGTGAGMAAPSDAIILFDGKDLSQWKDKDGGAAKWQVKNGVMTVVKGTGDITSKQEFGDFQLHIEWQIPPDITGKSQARGNSGIFLQDRYELQVLDNYNNRTYANGQASSIYKQTPPLVNAMRKPGEWNVYDVVYTAPRFKENGALFSPAKVTVLHNGVVTLNDFEIKGATEYIGLPTYKAHGKAPLHLQDHGDPSKAISYRNIWIREL